MKLIRPRESEEEYTNGACHHDGGIRSYTFVYNVKQKDIVVGMDAILADAQMHFNTLRATPETRSPNSESAIPCATGN